MKITTLLISILAFFGITQSTYGQTKPIKYSYETSLKKLSDDKLAVRLKITGFSEDTLTYCFPKIIPGIYGAMNFGQYISAFEVFDKKGNKLKTEKTDLNSWKIYDAKRISRVSYLVDDAWEAFDENMKNGFYRSAASSFSDSSFVITPNSLFGYFRGHVNHPIELTIQKGINLYPATSLRKTVKPNQDFFDADNYHQLVDNPILYALPDTTMIHLPGISVEVACHSTSGKPISKDIAEYIRPLLINQAKYLNNKLPVDHYTFLIYHSLASNRTHLIGDGLEHSNSTLILLYMPLDIETIRQNIYGIASHEFFHTLMPLGLHSYEIENYDYNDPKFSKHLWLYEGMTEYFTMHMPVKTGLRTEKEFFKIVEEKMAAMKQFDPNLAISDLSLHPMEHQEDYYNVYLRGALINLCLDIQLRELSGGEYGTKDLVLDLIKHYRGKPFEDNQLFKEIVNLSDSPELETFIADYIKGTKELPLEELLLKAGLKIQNGKITEVENPTTEQQKLRAAWLH
ncbi:peptidase M61 domain-containing protein [Fluviicola taffensis]|uniref:Peptidase M61 domain protein n=1 Tax=Fluviicola taffensis (strain DSM 16823 / NCIMB 13979 / RW262) TaxID=755732 RepID=F2ICX7_FLUTR|nr:peptidase M61 domain-containing protein [Fluviicola taffensis]AEA43351.1 peptidase M61 domain protein [Fluviicola taffensis DSM 16823]